MADEKNSNETKKNKEQPISDASPITIEDFLTRIVQLLLQHKYASQIAADIHVSKQKISYWIGKMLEWGWIELGPESTKRLKFYQVIKMNAQSEATSVLSQKLSDYKKVDYRPHNIRYLVPIAAMDENAEIPNKQLTGRKGALIKGSVIVGNTKVEYNIGKKKRSIVAYWRTPIRTLVKKPSDIQDELDKIESYIIEDLKTFSKNYNVVLDLDHKKRVFSELGIKHWKLTFPESMRLRDTIFKKVYASDELEFIQDPIHAKNFVSNMALKDFEPELVGKIDRVEKAIEEKLTPAILYLTENLKTHVNVEKGIEKGIGTLNKNLSRKDRHALFINHTCVAGKRKKRWQCFNCKGRWNLKPDLIGKHRCRFCKRMNLIVR